MDELYDLAADPGETRNLIFTPEHRERVDAMRRRLYEVFGENGGRQIPVGVKSNHGNNPRRAGSPRAAFPDHWIRG